MKIDTSQKDTKSKFELKFGDKLFEDSDSDQIKEKKDDQELEQA